MNNNVPPLPGPPAHARRPIGEANDAPKTTTPHRGVSESSSTALRWRDSCNERN